MFRKVKSVVYFWPNVKKNWREGKRRLNNEEMTEEPKAYTLVRTPRVISQVEQRLCVMVSISSNCG